MAVRPTDGMCKRRTRHRATPRQAVRNSRYRRKWRFGIIPAYSQMPGDFALDSFSARAWHTVDLPHSFNTPMCQELLADIPSPYAPEDSNPIGCYIRTVSIPRAWADQQVFIRFDDFRQRSCSM